jgi:hypothetical protein
LGGGGVGCGCPVESPSTSKEKQVKKRRTGHHKHARDRKYISVCSGIPHRWKYLFFNEICREGGHISKWHMICRLITLPEITFHLSMYLFTPTNVM